MKAVRNKAQVWVFEALVEITAGFPFPVVGIDSDNGSEFINGHLLLWCDAEQITFTRSRPGHKNDGAHVEQKNWSIVRRSVGYHRYDTPAQLGLLNEIYALLRLQTNFFSPLQKLISKTRHGATVTKRYDLAQTPYRRVLADQRVSRKVTRALTSQYRQLNPAQLRRDIMALQDRLLRLVRTANAPLELSTKPATATRASADEATRRPRRAS